MSGGGETLRRFAADRGPWDLGDTFINDGQRWRIVDMLDAQPTDPRCAGVCLVEPAVWRV